MTANFIEQRDYPETIVMDSGEFIQYYTEQLNQDWLFVIDLEFLLSIIFEHITANYVIGKFTSSVVDGVEELLMDSKSENTPMQKDFVKSVVNDLVRSIQQNLEQTGLLCYEHFPYRYDRLLAGGSIVLRKTQNNRCQV